jgi:adenylosuccinate synthase
VEDPVFSSFFREPDADPKWQGKFRLGHMDLLALRYAIALNGGIDNLALTNLDRLGGTNDAPPVFMYNSYIYEGDQSLLNKYFIWEDMGVEKARITDIKVPDLSQGGNKPFELADLLMKCRPFENVYFGSWSEDIYGAQGLSDLPVQARDLINFIGSKEGLGVPVKIVSVGQSSDDKFEID